MNARTLFYYKTILFGIILALTAFLGYMLFVQSTVNVVNVADLPGCSNYNYQLCILNPTSLVGDFECFLEGQNANAQCCNAGRTTNTTLNPSTCVNIGSETPTDPRNVPEGGACTPEGTIECISGICCGCNKCLGSSGGTCD